MTNSGNHHQDGTREERRFFIDRRQFSYARAIPERRSGEERRGTVNSACRADVYILDDVVSADLNTHALPRFPSLVSSGFGGDVSILGL